MDAKEFEARVKAFDLRLDGMFVAAEKESRDISGTVADLKRERDSIIENFHRTFDDPLPPDEPLGGAPVGARRKPAPPARPSADAKPFPTG